MSGLIPKNEQKISFIKHFSKKNKYLLLNYNRKQKLFYSVHFKRSCSSIKLQFGDF